MRMSRSVQNHAARKFRPGDKVKFNMVGGVVYGHVVEDHGNIGIGGRQLVRVTAGTEPNQFEIEMSADEIEPVD